MIQLLLNKDDIAYRKIHISDKYSVHYLQHMLILNCKYIISNKMYSFYFQSKRFHSCYTLNLNSIIRLIVVPLHKFSSFSSYRLLLNINNMSHEIMQLMTE